MLSHVFGDEGNHKEILIPEREECESSETRTVVVSVSAHCRSSSGHSATPKSR